MKKIRTSSKNRKYLLLVIIILLLAGCSSFSNLQKEAKEYSAPVFSAQIEVSAPRQIEGVAAKINKLAFKPGLSPGKSIEHNGKKLWPLINLDLYGLKGNEKVKVGSNKFKAAYKVKITYSIDKAKESGIDQLNLHFLVNDKWLTARQMQDSGAIEKYTSKAGKNSFTILDWPLDDRMIGGN